MNSFFHGVRQSEGYLMSSQSKSFWYSGQQSSGEPYKVVHEGIAYTPGHPSLPILARQALSASDLSQTEGTV